MTQKFWVILYRFSTPKTARKVLIDRNHAAQQQSPLSSGCFASGIPQGRHLQMPGRSWRAGAAERRWKARGP